MGLKFDSLTVMSLDVRGRRDVLKREATFLLCKNSEADFMFLQETRWSESDVKLWKGQWGKQIYCGHARNRSAGVSVCLHQFKGEILEVVSSHDGRWILIMFKHENSHFIGCDIYGQNSHSSNQVLCGQMTSKINPNSSVILGGDFYECPDDAIDRPPQNWVSLF